MLRIMMMQSGVMSKSTWLHSNLSIAVMGVGALLGLEVITPRGKLFEQRVVGILIFRKGHLTSDAAFSQKAAEGKPAVGDKKYQEFARDYFVILTTNFNFLAWCHRVSVIGWAIACLTVMFVLDSLRKSHSLVKLTDQGPTTSSFR